MKAKTIEQSFAVSFSYPVVFGRDLFAPGQPHLRDAVCRLGDPVPHRVLVFVDAGLVAAQPGLPERIQAYCAAHAGALELVQPPQAVPGGEAAKNDDALIVELVDTLLAQRLCRHSCVIAVGGGAMIDAVGFAAAMVHRGLRLVRMPSTTLAQNDAGIGVKNGINRHGGKNTLGTFQPPFAVLNDLDLLDSLPDEHWIGGVSEAFKVAMIKDAAFFKALCRDAGRYRQRDRSAQEAMVIRCAQLHLEHIATNGDPFESGLGRPLDFGHWAAHKLEGLSGYRISHGAAVAVGLAIDTLYAARRGWIDPADAAALMQALAACGFPVWHPEMAQRLADGRLALLQGLDDFQEHLGGELCVTFPAGLGRKQEVNTIDHPLMEQVIRTLKPSDRRV